MELAQIFLDLVKQYGYDSALFTIVTFFLLQNLKSTNIIRDFVNKVKSPTPIRFQDLVKTNLYLSELLYQFVEDLGGQRVIVMLYHNGEHSIGGYNFTKMSCTHEVLAKQANEPGKQIKSHIKDLSNIPVTAFYLVVKSMFDAGELFIKNINDIKRTNPSTYEELKRRGAKAAIFFPLLDNTDHIFGHVCFEFPKTLTSKKAESMRPHIHDCAQRISSVIEMISQGGINGQPNQKA